MSYACYRKYISWIILGFAALNVIFLGGKRRAFGSFVASLRRTYPNITLTELNWIGDSYSAFGYMSTSVTTAIIIHGGRRYRIFQLLGSVFVLVSCVTSAFVPNPHWLFLTHTLLHGIGSSLILSTIGLVVNEHFNANHKYHILATTLVSGGSVASILFVVFFAFLIQVYQWRLAFIILGVLYFVITASLAVFLQRANDLDEYKLEETRKGSPSLQIMTRHQIPLVLLWLIDRVLTSVVTYGLLLNLTDYLHRTVSSLIDSTVLTMLFASGEAVTYLLGAVVTAITRDLLANRLKYILLVTSLFMGVSLIVSEFVSHISWALKLLMFIAGFCLGPSITFLYPAGEEMTTLTGHIAYPISLGGMGLGMMVSPLFSAKVAEIFDYKWFFFIQGLLIFVKLFALLLMTFLAKVLPKRNPEIKCFVIEEDK